MSQVKPEELESVFRSRVRALRKALGLTQEELAARMECTTAYISQLETQPISVGLGQIAKLAEALETTPEQLVKQPATESKRATARRRSPRKLAKTLVMT